MLSHIPCVLFIAVQELFFSFITCNGFVLNSFAVGKGGEPCCIDTNVCNFMQMFVNLFKLYVKLMEGKIHVLIFLTQLEHSLIFAFLLVLFCALKRNVYIINNASLQQLIFIVGILLNQKLFLIIFRFRIIPLHSMLSSEEQSLVFK